MKINIRELYSPRLLVFIETDPQTNVYRQVLLTAEQFKNVSKDISTLVKEADENGIETVNIRESEGVYSLPDLQDIHS